MSHLGELAKLSAKDIDGPLSELNKRGRILAVIYETGDESVHIEFWQQPTPKVLRNLRETFRHIRRHLPFKSYQPKENN